MLLAEDHGELLIYESTTECPLPCYIQGKRFNGTQAHEIGPRLEGYNGKVWHYPLAIPLRPWERKALSRHLNENLGRPYDTLGATRSGGKIWSRIHRSLHPESLSALFCSESTANALRDIERFDTVSASEWSPNAFIRECTRRGIVLYPRRLK